MAGVLPLSAIAKPPTISAANVANEAEGRPPSLLFGSQFRCDLSLLLDFLPNVFEGDHRAFERSLALPRSLSRVLVLAVIASSATSASEAPTAAASPAVASVVVAAVVAVVTAVTAIASCSRSCGS